MSEIKEWIELKETLRLFVVWGITGLVDSLFLALWVAIQWLVDSNVITPLELSGIDSLVLDGFQVLFAISTLAPVAITIYRDIRIMLIRTQRKIRSEIEIGDGHESN